MMNEFIVGHLPYYFITVLLVVGLYGMLFKKNYVKKVIGMNIFQYAIIIFYVSSGWKPDATVPVITPLLNNLQTNLYINPLPHTLMLTAIVVCVATTGVALALLIVIFKRYGTLQESELLERMK